MTYNRQLHMFISQLSGRINRIEEAALEAGLEEGVSAAEIRIVQAIGLDGSGKMGDVSKALGISLATFTVSCDKLETRGFIEKRRDVKDKRTVRVSLTEKGTIAYRFHMSFVEGLIDMLLTELSEEERAALRAGIEKVNRLVGAMASE